MTAALHLRVRRHGEDSDLGPTESPQHEESAGTTAAEGNVAPPGRRVATYAGLTRVGFTIVSILLALAVWQLAVVAMQARGAGSLFMASPAETMESLRQLIAEPAFYRHLRVTAIEVIVGVVLAAVVGITVGFLLGYSRLMRRLFDPWVTALYSTPLIALAPLFVIWLGIGAPSKIAVVFLVGIFPIIINTALAVDSVDPIYLDVIDSVNGNSWHRFRKVYLPFALPYILTGLRLAVGRGMTGAVAAEFLGSVAGLGYLVLIASQTFNVSRLFAVLVILIALGVTAISGLKRLERILIPWKPSNL